MKIRIWWNKMSQEAKLTANQYTNVKDIKENFLFTKNGYLMAYIKINRYNIDLLKQEEKRGKSNQLAASFEGDRKEFAYVSYPREIDIDDHKQDVKERYRQEENIGIRNILEIILETYNHLSTSGENYSHQHYIKIWSYIGKREIREVKLELLQRAKSFVQRYDAVGIKAEILNENEIIKMCNLFGNALQAPFEVPVDSTYERMTFIG